MIDNELIDTIRREVFEECGIWISRKAVRGLVVVISHMANGGKAKQ